MTNGIRISRLLLFYAVNRITYRVPDSHDSLWTIPDNNPYSGNFVINQVCIHCPGNFLVHLFSRKQWQGKLRKLELSCEWFSWHLFSCSLNWKVTVGCGNRRVFEKKEPFRLLRHRFIVACLSSIYEQLSTNRQLYCPEISTLGRLATEEGIDLCQLELSFSFGQFVSWVSRKYSLSLAIIWTKFCCWCHA